MKSLYEKIFRFELTRERIVLIGIILLALILRTYNIDWDSGQRLHPDERFLSMVSYAIQIPYTVFEYLDPLRSPLNPYNHDFSFFVYGTFPITLNKIIATALNFSSFHGLTIFGRFLSALADIGTMLVVFLIARRWETRYRFHATLKYWSMFVYAVTVLAIQQSHFFTTDTFAIFFSFVSIYNAMRFYDGMQEYSSLMRRPFIFSAIAFGLALGSKASVVWFAPLIGLYLILGVVGKQRSLYWKAGQILQVGAYFGSISYVILRLADPHIFASDNIFNVTLSSQYLANIAELNIYSNAQAQFPPVFQWRNKMPLVYPLSNIVLFGFGIVPFALSIFGMYFVSRKRISEFLIVFFWMAFFFVAIGLQDVVTMRYFYPLYPFLALFAGYGCAALWKHTEGLLRNVVVPLVILVVLVWPYMFMQIYTQEHPHVQASQWIYENIPAGSVIINQHWDDPLPLQFPEEDEHGPMVLDRYETIEAEVFIPDTEEKREMLLNTFEKGDLFVLATNRTYGVMLGLEDTFPVMTQLYRDLFAGRLGYERVAEFTNYPRLVVPMGWLGQDDIVVWELNDQWAEEAFTVYDHPRVLLYQKVSSE